MNLYGYAGGDPVNYSDPFGLCPPKDTNVQDCESVSYWRGRASESESVAGKIGNTVMAGLAAVGEDAIATVKGQPVGDCGQKYACGTPPAVGMPGPVAGRITGFTKHGLNQAISRDGVGVASEAILDAVKNPQRTLQQARGAVKYVGENATVILNQAGEVVTTWARNSAGWRIQP
jgi:hypothetical protein